MSNKATYISWVSKNNVKTKIHARSFFNDNVTVCGRKIPKDPEVHDKFNSDKSRTCLKCIG